MTVEVRAAGCLKGLSCGDAVGKQTEGLTAVDVRRWYPNGVRGFEGPPGSVIPRYASNRKRKWLIGETTDDTERTLAVARAILRDREVRHASVGRELLTCQKCVHPGVMSLWEFHQAANPERVTDRHDGCGAAIRVAPVGILFGPERLDQIVAGAREASISTHGTPWAIASAAATAAAVSAAIGGASHGDVFERAERAAASVHAPFADALRNVHNDLSGLRELRGPEVAAKYSPVFSWSVVPLAIALGTLMNSAAEAILLAANIGGDSDSTASIAAAILGARFPDTVDNRWYAVVESINHHDLESVAEELCRLRDNLGIS
jgi:ADP-ribosylglycohydrolase